MISIKMVHRKYWKGQWNKAKIENDYKKKNEKIALWDCVVYYTLYIVRDIDAYTFH